jgi:hypothetical protein
MKHCSMGAPMVRTRTLKCEILNTPHSDKDEEQQKISFIACGKAK